MKHQLAEQAAYFDPGSGGSQAHLPGLGHPDGIGPNERRGGAGRRASGQRQGLKRVPRVGRAHAGAHGNGSGRYAIEQHLDHPCETTARYGDYLARRAAAGRQVCYNRQHGHQRDKARGSRSSARSDQRRGP